MLKAVRKLFGIRSAEERAVDRQRGERWLRIYRERALATGELPPEDILKGSGLGADDPFWKQDNSKPEEGFAVNVDISLGRALELGGKEPDGFRSVDDFGRHVPLIPIMETGSVVGFDFVNARPSLDLKENQTPGEFLHLLGGLVQDLFDREDELEGIEIYSDRGVMDVPVKRLYWNTAGDFWQVTVELPEED